MMTKVAAITLPIKRRTWLTLAMLAASPLFVTPSCAKAAAGPVSKRSIGADMRSARPLSQVGQWIVDDAGRVVQLHGLTLYQKKPPYLEQVSDQDLNYLVGQGFNAFRINWVWQAAEPTPGRYDDTYIDKIAALNDRMAEHGIRTLIGPANNSLSPRFGGFGNPLWATINRIYCQKPGESDICIKNIAERYLGADAEFEAWDNFYGNAPASDGVGVLTHFAHTWKRVASRLKTRGNVFALDLFHEPAPGLTYVKRGERRFFTEPVTFEREGLPPFYRTVAESVRKADPSPIIFFQTSTYAKLADFARAGIHVPPHFLPDPKVGLSVHFGPSDLANASGSDFASELGQSLTTARNFAESANTALVVTGYRLAKNEDQYAAFTDILGSRFVPWIYYTYKGMPDPGAESTGLVVDLAKPISDDNVRQARLDAMVVPYPELTAGTPISWTFDRATKTVNFIYSTKPVGPHPICAGAETEIFVPARHYPGGYAAEVTGATVESSPTSAWLVLRRAAGAAQVAVVIRPKTDSYTETPSTALGPSAGARCR